MAEIPKTSTKPWSEIVDEADPNPEPIPEYQFSNGRKFFAKKP
jgi:hypothetical protein